jgi:hypothetical protein
MLKRANDPSYPVDRFFLVTFEDGLAAIKVRRFMAYQVPFQLLIILLQVNRSTNS